MDRKVLLQSYTTHYARAEKLSIDNKLSMMDLNDYDHLSVAVALAEIWKTIFGYRLHIYSTTIEELYSFVWNDLIGITN